MGPLHGVGARPPPPPLNVSVTNREEPCPFSSEHTLSSNTFTFTPTHYIKGDKLRKIVRSACFPTAQSRTLSLFPRYPQMDIQGILGGVWHVDKGTTTCLTLASSPVETQEAPPHTMLSAEPSLEPGPCSLDTPMRLKVTSGARNRGPASLWAGKPAPHAQVQCPFHEVSTGTEGPPGACQCVSCRDH